MKMRNSFVSNSSSASFVLDIYYDDEDATTEDILYFLDVKVPEIYIPNEAAIEYNLYQVESCKFRIKTWVVIYNTIYDIPSYMRDIYLAHLLHDADPLFDEVKLTVKEE